MSFLDLWSFLVGLKMARNREPESNTSWLRRTPTRTCVDQKWSASLLFTTYLFCCNILNLSYIQQSYYRVLLLVYDYCFFLTRCLAFVLCHLFVMQHAGRRTDYDNVVISVLLYLKVKWNCDFKKSWPILLNTTMSNFKKGYKTRRVWSVKSIWIWKQMLPIFLCRWFLRGFFWSCKFCKLLYVIFFRVKFIKLQRFFFVLIIINCWRRQIKLVLHTTSSSKHKAIFHFNLSIDDVDV